MAEATGFWQRLLGWFDTLFGKPLPEKTPIEDTVGPAGGSVPPISPHPAASPETTAAPVPDAAPEPANRPDPIGDPVPADVPQLGGRQASADAPAPSAVPAPSAAPSSETEIASGRGVWIWLLKQAEFGEVDRIIERAREAGLRWLAVKGGDGVHEWTQLTEETVRRIRAAGLQTLGWVYAYGQDTAREAAVARHVLSLGCDGLIIDAEAEYEGKAESAERYMRAIREAFPRAFIAYSTFPLVSRHPRFPYVEFGRYCNAVMPQCYWRRIGFTPEEMMSRTAAEWAEWSRRTQAGGYGNAIKPIVPVGQGFDAAPDEVRRFMAAAADYRGVSLWSWSHMSQEVWEAFSEPSRNRGQWGAGPWYHLSNEDIRGAE